MEKYLNLDLYIAESENLEDLGKELDTIVENYDNFIVLTDRKNLNLKRANPIKTLKKELEINHGIELSERRTLLVEIENELMVRAMFEEEEDVSKDAFMVLRKQGALIDLNR